LIHVCVYCWNRIDACVSNSLYRIVGTNTDYGVNVTIKLYAFKWYKNHVCGQPIKTFKNTLHE
jgi:hypothetical protein